MEIAHRHIAILILAAGTSSRLGQPKQLVKLGEKTLLEHMTETALSTGYQPIVVVLGAYFEKIQTEIAHLPVTILNNENWAGGMGSTVACGMHFLIKNHPEIDAVLLMVCDQLLLRPAVLKNLVEKWRETNAPIIASEYGGTFGVPAVFDQKLFAELAALDGEKGAKPLMMRHLKSMVLVPFPEGKTDLDTPEDLAKVNG